MHNLQQQLSIGLQALTQGNFPLAEQNFARILATNPTEPNALYFLGAVKKSQGQMQEAIALMKRSLTANPKQAQVSNGLGNIYKELDDLKAAKKYYLSALDSDPNYAEASFNIGLLLQDSSPHEALTAFQKATKLQPQNTAFQNAMGVAYQNLKDLTKAEQCFQLAIRLNNKNYKAFHNLGALYKDQYRYEDAIKYLSQAIALAPHSIEPRYIRANIYYELGDFEKADTEYRTVIGIDPAYIDAHTSLNKLYWEHRKTDLYGKSYIVGIKKHPQSAELCLHHLRAMQKSGKIDEAIERSHEYSKQFPRHAPLAQTHAQIHAAHVSAEQATALFEQATALAPDDKNIRIDTSRHYIKTHDYKSAIKHLDAAENISKYDQEMWAYKSLCWRLQGDERHEWLTDHNHLIHAAKIAVPKGYNNLPDFMNHLRETLKALHTTKRAPIDQTLIGGSQTHGKLFDRTNPVITSLKSALSETISPFIQNLPTDKTHPLYNRNTGNFSFSASWSVWLRDGGFHINHIHPLGWFSSSFYVEVPNFDEEARNKKQGWIKFGESGLELGGVDQPFQFIEPEEGLLALFPSFMWHGTVPFEGTSDRITAPFDIIPN